MQAEPKTQDLTDQEDTPSALWRLEGKPDPHEGHYTGPRRSLCMGKLTDDELANAAFMNFDVRPALEDLIAGKAFTPLVWMTAVKERIRWLSRQLVKYQQMSDTSYLRSFLEKRRTDSYSCDVLAKDLLVLLDSHKESAVPQAKIAQDSLTYFFRARVESGSPNAWTHLDLKDLEVALQNKDLEVAGFSLEVFLSK